MGTVKGKEHKELAELEKRGHALYDTLWQERAAMFGSHPESMKGSAEKSCIGCKTTALRAPFGLKVSPTKATPEEKRKDGYLLEMVCLS